MKKAIVLATVTMALVFASVAFAGGSTLLSGYGGRGGTRDAHVRDGQAPGEEHASVHGRRPRTDRRRWPCAGARRHGRSPQRSPEVVAREQAVIPIRAPERRSGRVVVRRAHRPAARTSSPTSTRNREGPRRAGRASAGRRRCAGTLCGGVECLERLTRRGAGMRLLCVYQHAPTPGAPGIYRHRLYLAELVRRGWHVDLVSTPVNYMTGDVPPRYAGRPYVREVIDGIVHHWVWASGKIHGSRTRRGAQLPDLRLSSATAGGHAARPDVVYASSPPLPVGTLGALLAKRYRRPWILEVRDVWPESAVSVGWLSEDSLAYRTLERMALTMRRPSTRDRPEPGLVEPSPVTAPGTWTSSRASVLDAGVDERSRARIRARARSRRLRRASSSTSAPSGSRTASTCCSTPFACFRQAGERPRRRRRGRQRASGPRSPDRRRADRPPPAPRGGAARPSRATSSQPPTSASTSCGPIRSSPRRCRRRCSSTSARTGPSSRPCPGCRASSRSRAAAESRRRRGARGRARAVDGDVPRRASRARRGELPVRIAAVRARGHRRPSRGDPSPGRPPARARHAGLSLRA